MTDLMTTQMRTNDGASFSHIEEEISGLFAEDGTIYLVSGFFTYRAFERLRPEIVQFLSRSADNELVVVIGAGLDQFSPKIAHNLARMERSEQVEVLKYTDGFLHTKLYLRTGENPVAIIGSANLTTVAFTQNTELGLRVRPDNAAFDEVLQYRDALLDASEPATGRDLFRPVMAYNTLVNWSNKGRLLPFRTWRPHPTWIGFGLILVVSIWLHLG